MYFIDIVSLWWEWHLLDLTLYFFVWNGTYIHWHWKSLVGMTYTHKQCMSLVEMTYKQSSMCLYSGNDVLISTVPLRWEWNINCVQCLCNVCRWWERHINFVQCMSLVRMAFKFWTMYVFGENGINFVQCMSLVGKAY